MAPASSALHNALRANRYQQFRYLVHMGADPNQQDSSGCTPLMKCSYVKSTKAAVKLAQALLKYGADKCQQDTMGMTSLHHTAKCGQAHVMEILLEDVDHYDLNQEDVYQNTTLHYACASGSMDTVKLVVNHMLRYYLGVNIRNNVGFTPLHIACQNGYLNIARLLVNKAKASLTVKDGMCFRTPREWLELHYNIPYDVNPFECEVFVEAKNLFPQRLNKRNQSPRPKTAPTIVRLRCKRISNERNIEPRPVTAPVRKTGRSQGEATMLNDRELPDISDKPMIANKEITSWQILQQLYRTFEGQLSPSFRKHVKVTFPPKPEISKKELKAITLLKQFKKSESDSMETDSNQGENKSVRLMRGLLLHAKKASKENSDNSRESSRTNSPSPDKSPKLKPRLSANKFKLARRLASQSSDGIVNDEIPSSDEQKGGALLAKLLKKPKQKSLSIPLLKASKDAPGNEEIISDEQKGAALLAKLLKKPKPKSLSTALLKAAKKQENVPETVVA